MIYIFFSYFLFSRHGNIFVLNYCWFFNFSNTSSFIVSSSSSLVSFISLYIFTIWLIEYFFSISSSSYISDIIPFNILSSFIFSIFFNNSSVVFDILLSISFIWSVF